MIDIFTQYLKDEGKSENLVCPTSSGILEMANKSKDVKKGRSKYNLSYIH